jgi:hypothetical protein
MNHLIPRLRIRMGTNLGEASNPHSAGGVCLNGTGIWLREITLPKERGHEFEPFLREKLGQLQVFQRAPLMVPNRVHGPHGHGRDSIFVMKPEKRRRLQQVAEIEIV